MIKSIKIIGRFVFHFFEILIGIVAAYAIVLLVGGIIATGVIDKNKEFTLYVQSNGVHTDFVMPVRSKVINWHSFVPLADFPAVKDPTHIAVGWGDKGFFLDTPEWSDLTLATALNAAFLPSETAMHVAYYAKEPQENERVSKITIDENQYQSLVDYILNTFRLNNAKVELIPNRGYWRNDNFYEANHSYHLFNTCNSWTNAGLKLIHIKTGIFALSADGIMRHLK